MKKRIRTIIGIIVGIIIGVSTTVGATTIFNSKDITYSNSATSKTNVKDSLDELYTKVSKVGQCPEGQLCLESKISNLPMGSVISMTPTSTSYTISKDLTGHTNDQTINPRELNLWRVIRKNSDETVDVVSNFVSNQKVTFEGKTGYMNYIKVLNTIANQYTNSKYVSKSRHMGFEEEIETCTVYSTTECIGDNDVPNDVELVKNAIGYLATSHSYSQGNAMPYFLASRYGIALARVKTIDTSGAMFSSTLVIPGGSSEMSVSAHLRPILTLKADVKIKSGDGTVNSPYQLS